MPYTWQRKYFNSSSVCVKPKSKMAISRNGSYPDPGQHKPQMAILPASSYLYLRAK